MRFAITIFSSAFLLFQVQPVIGHFILPWFGGGPSVWTVSVLFFQALLLGGYLYAHVLSVGFSPRSQAVIHFTLLVASLLLLPIAPSDSWKPMSGEKPFVQILWLLVATVGGPYFLLASTGPLLQRWYSRTSVGGSPYRLYALSNAGSLLALLSYPFLFEPWLTLNHQILSWTGMYVGYVALAGWCAVLLFHQRDVEPAGIQSGALPLVPQTQEHATVRPGWGLMLFWFSLAAAGSVMLLATTNRMCLDTAAVPLLWVLPLSVYLLSLIICFDKPVWYDRRVFGVLLLVSFLAACRVMRLGGYTPLAELVLVYSAVLFACCMTCHGELVRTRPAPQYLTLFYLIVAAGGAMGGMLVAAIAPAVLNHFLEYQIGLVVCGVLYVVGLSIDRVLSQPLSASFWIGATSSMVQSTCCFFSFFLPNSSAFSSMDATITISVYLFIQFTGLALTAAWEARRNRVLWLWGGVSIAQFVWLAAFGHLRSSPPMPESMLLPIVLSAVLPAAAFGSILAVSARMNHANLQRWIVWMLLAGATCVIGGMWYSGSIALWKEIALVIVLLALATGTFLSWASSIQFLWLPSATLLLLFTIDFAESVTYLRANKTHSSRNFYGVLSVRFSGRRFGTNGKAGSPPYYSLDHGQIMHGLQFLDEDRKRQPTTYYGFQSGIGQAIRIARELVDDDGAGHLRVGVVGLGTGTLAAFGRKGDYFRFYEINPDVLSLAQNTFTYLADSKATIEVVMGDARICMERELAAGDQQHFDILAIDAFSSDAIPVHLLTTECGDIYKQHLKPDGILAIHISNRFLDLTSVTRGLAEHLGCQAIPIVSQSDDSLGVAAANWVLVTANERATEHPAVVAARQADNSHKSKLQWTDDYQSLWHVVSFE